MSDSKNHDTPPTCNPTVANRGPVRPPLVYAIAIALGLLLHVLWPARLVPRAVATPAGAAVVLIAIWLFVSAVRALGAAGTPVPGNLPTAAIVRTGPYRFTRNPIYLAFSLLQFGLAVWVNSLALLVTEIPAVALIALVMIPREERYLEERFPTVYPAYRASVRRWL